ncbi:MAG: hypothetical protein WC565_04090 [Parcubacteria group bacterium]
MAFIEPAGFSPFNRVKASRKKAKKSSPKKRSVGATRMRRAVVGGVSRTSPVPASLKETKKMAKKRRRSSKKRTPAQIAATKRMIAANRKANPTKAKTGRKRAGTKITKSDSGNRTVKVTMAKKRRRPMPKQTAAFVRTVGKRLQKAKKKTVRYSMSSKGKARMIIRENPANQTKAIVSAAGGFILGLAGADVLDRYVATRKGDSTAVKTNDDATLAIHKKADGIRIFAQAAAAGGLSVGAFLLRKKSVIGTYLLAGMATGFAAKGITLIIKDYLMPKLLEPKAGETKLANRLQYGVAGPRGYMRPFLGKPMMIGPQAAGSVGKYGCTRVPVDPSNYVSDGRESCRPWPFDIVGGGGSDCMDTVNARPPITRQPQMPPVSREPGQPIQRSPRDPDGKFLPSDASTVDQDTGSGERRVYQPPRPTFPGFDPPVRPEGVNVPLESGVNRYSYDPQRQQVSPSQREGLTRTKTADRSDFVVPQIVGAKGPARYRFPGR